MRSLNVQIQPDRSSVLDLDKVNSLFEALRGSPLVQHSQVDKGADNGRYINFTYGTNDAELLWKTIQEQIYRSNEVGEAISICSIAVCSSEEGWDDYLLLHHYDPKERVDSFDTR